MKRIAVLLALSILSGGTLLLTGCLKPSTNSATLAPGAVNQFDEQSYAVLSASQATLNSLKASNVPSIAPVLNQAILAYNTAESAYQVYHQAAAAGQNPSTAPVSSAISDLQTKITAVQTAATEAK